MVVRCFYLMIRQAPRSTLVPCTTLFRFDLACSSRSDRGSLLSDSEEGRVVGDGVVGQDIDRSQLGADGVGTNSATVYTTVSRPLSICASVSNQNSTPARVSRTAVLLYSS